MDWIRVVKNIRSDDWFWEGENVVKRSRRGSGCSIVFKEECRRGMGLNSLGMLRIFWVFDISWGLFKIVGG